MLCQTATTAWIRADWTLTVELRLHDSEGRASLHQTNLLDSTVSDLTVRFLPYQIWLANPLSMSRYGPPSGFSLWADVYPRMHTISCYLLFNVWRGGQCESWCVHGRCCLLLSLWLFLNASVCLSEWHLVAFQGFGYQRCYFHHKSGGYGDWQTSCRGFDNNRSVSWATV